MALTKVTYSMINGAAVNALDYGADPTGVSSSTNAIQTAIDSGAASIYFPAGTYLCGGLTASDNPVVFFGEGRESSILKNNTASAILLTISDLAAQSSVNNLTFDNNSVPNSTLSVTTYYVSIDNLFFQNHGNSTTQYYGLHLDGATISNVSNIYFKDLDTTYGGHLYVDTSYYSVFTNIVCARAGTNINDAFGIRVNACEGGIFNGLYIEEGGGAGAARFLSCTGLSIQGLNAEFYAARNPNSGRFIYFESCNGLSVTGARLFHGTATTTYPLIALNSVNSAKFSGLWVRRTTNSNGIMIFVGANCSNVSIDTVFAQNAVSLQDITPVAYTFVDASATGTNFSLTNFKSYIGTATHLINNITGAVVQNVEGTLDTTSSIFGQTYEAGANLFASYSSDATNVTGDGTAYTLVPDNEQVDLNTCFNVGTGTFTAPTIGLYCFNVVVFLKDISSSHTSGSCNLITTNVTYEQSINYYSISVGGEYTINQTWLIFLQSGNTASAALTVSGGSKVVDVRGANRSYISGYLVK